MSALEQPVNTALSDSDSRGAPPPRRMPVPVPVPVPMPAGTQATRYAPPPLGQPVVGAGSYVGWTVTAGPVGTPAWNRNANRPAPSRSEAATAAIWWYVFSPIVVAAALVGVAAANLRLAGATVADLQISFGSLWALRGTIQVVATAALGFLLTLALLFRDRSLLRERGFESIPSPWWQLFSPLGYLLIRTVRVTGQSGGGLAPLLVFVGIYVAPFLVFGLIAGLESLRA